MEIVIKIPEEDYEKILKDPFLNDGVYLAIKNGTPLEDIRAEIEQKYIDSGFDDYDYASGLNCALHIIDRHMKG